MGKIDNLQKLLTKEGKIAIAAIDHRGLLKKLLHPENPELTTEAEILKWKQRMVEIDKNRVSGLLIDPTDGKNLIDLTAKCGWLLSMEKTGYRGGKEERVTELLPDWSVRQAKEMGACAAKLLLYYDPDNRELAEKQKYVAKRVAEECIREKIVFLLEPLSYKNNKVPYLVERMVDDLLDLPVDIFKLEYPGNRSECERITKKLKVPWVLLSAGVAYEQYKEQLKMACESGAAGMAVGRAAWQEFGQYEGEAREQFFREVVSTRMDELINIVNKYGKSVENN
ncbi:MAG: tagatose 1,6-diphosphate aldolase [bacterium]